MAWHVRHAPQGRWASSIRLERARKLLESVMRWAARMPLQCWCGLWFETKRARAAV